MHHNPYQPPRVPPTVDDVRDAEDEGTHAIAAFLFLGAVGLLFVAIFLVIYVT